tara:strand:+ start:19790 stop:20074 length:285 start_codon:yes stop_codon:yes gene_type:complete
MVGVFAILKIQEGSNKEFESAARLMEEAVKKNEPGNNYYNFYKGQDDTTYIVMERYNSQEDLDAHSQTEHMKTIGAEMGKYLSGAPEIKVFESL